MPVVLLTAIAAVAAMIAALEGLSPVILVVAIVTMLAVMGEVVRRRHKESWASGARVAPRRDGVRQDRRLFRAGQRPGPGRYRCDVCSWVVQLDDEAEDVSTGPFAVTLPGETRPGDAKLPACLGCGGLGTEPIFERVADDPPDATSAFSPTRRSDGTPVEE